MSTPPGAITRGPDIVGVAIAFPILAAVFVGARVYTRTRLVRMFGIDDYFSIGTLVIAIAYSVLVSIWTTHGGGMYGKDMTQEINEEYYKWVMIMSEFYVLGLFGYKTAILLLYIRIFSVNKKFKTLCYIVMAVNGAYLLSNLILQIFSCNPVPKYYDKDLPGSCVNLVPANIVWGAMSMVSDFAIAWLPIPLVVRLKLSKRDRLLISLVFLSGLIAFLMALIRWILATIDMVAAPDREWLAGLTFLFSIIEVNTGIICGCTATLKPLVRFARDHTSRRKSSSNGKYEKKGLFHHRSASSDEEKGHAQNPRAPPGTLLEATVGKEVETRDDSPDSHASEESKISKATTARPSLTQDTTNTGFSQDLLNLPKEGTRAQPALHPRRDTYEVESPPAAISPQELPSPALHMTQVIADTDASPMELENKLGPRSVQR